MSFEYTDNLGNWIAEKYMSGHIARFRWGGETLDGPASLFIAFLSNTKDELAVYEYYDVDPKHYKGLIDEVKAGNGAPGRYVNRKIIPTHSCDRFIDCSIDEIPDAITP